MKMMHKFFIVTIHACVPIFFLTAANTFAQETNIPPEWQQEQVIDLSAFKYSIELPAFRIDIPTVVEVPVDASMLTEQNAVVYSSNGTYQYAYFKTYRHEKESPTRVMTPYDPFMFSTVLDDNNIETDVSYPFVSGEDNTAKVTFSTLLADGGKVTATGVRFTFSPNVDLPKTVAIQARSADGNMRTLVAEKRMTGTIISFPKTTSDTFEVTFGLSQPLRIAEAELIEEISIYTTVAIRFLAQPGERYTIYLDPDRFYGTVDVDAARLSDDRNVLLYQETGTVSLSSNSLYQFADVDSDGVPDMSDNCPRIPNPDQIDVDGNGVGDMCDDFDKDGIITLHDNCPTQPNRTQVDTDGDGIGDVCDTEEDRFTERNPWIPWAGIVIAGTVLVLLFGMSFRMKTGGAVKDKESEGKLDTSENLQ